MSKPKNPNAVALGSLGGKAGRGRPKNRTKAQSRQMALKGWKTRRRNTVGGIWWCNSHHREATHIDQNGKHCCDPSLGGILLPCFTVFTPMSMGRKK